MRVLPAFRHTAAALVVAVSLGVPSPAAALDPSRRLIDYAHDVWKMTDGLPQDSITAVLQTRDGYLWLATLDGLARFDGVTFDTFNLIRVAGLESNVVTALAEDHRGTLWIGTRSGLVRYESGRFTAITTRHGLSNDSVRALCTTRDGSLWVGTRWGGLNRLLNGTFTAVRAADGLLDFDVRGVAEDASGTLWVATGSGLNYVRDGKVFAAAFDGPAIRRLVASVYVDRHDTVWLGANDGLWALRAGERSSTGAPTVVRKHLLHAVEVRALHEDRDGNVWAGLGSGLARVRGDSVEVAGIGLLSHANVRSLGTDHEGSLWVGTDGGGLNRLREASVTMIDNPAEDPEASVMVVHRDPGGTMWTGANCGGISKWEGSRSTTLTTKDGLPDNCIRSLASGPDGSLWVGTLGGLAVLKNGRFTRYTTADGLSSNRVMAIAVDRAGTAWIGTGGAGIDRFAGGVFTNDSTKNGLAHDDVRAVLAARDGTVWVGTLGGGLSRWRNGRFETLAREHGLSNNNVLALHEDEDGTLWVGTNGGGLNRLRGGVIAHYSTQNGLFHDGLFHILDDGVGYLWMSCNRGVFRVSRQDFEDVAAGRRSAVRSESFGRAEGLKPGGAMGGTQPAGAVGPEGRLWFPTINAVAVIDPRHLVRNTVAPLVHVVKVTVDRRVVEGEGLSNFAPGSRSIEIAYAGLTFVAPGKAQFRYRLEGQSHEWEDVGARRTAYYMNLRPGRYRFTVVASNNDGVWNDKGATVEFEILPFFYETRLFYAGCVTLAFGALLLGLRLRERRNRTRERELQQQVDLAMAEVKVLSGLLPICASCKRIRDEADAWKPVESYIHEHSQASFSHGICPDCMKKLYPEF